MRRRRHDSWIVRNIAYSTEGCTQSSPTNTREKAHLDILLQQTRVLGLRDITEETVDEWRYRYIFGRWAGMRYVNRWDSYDQVLTLWMGLTTDCEYRTREEWIQDFKNLDRQFQPF